MKEALIGTELKGKYFRMNSTLVDGVTYEYHHTGNGYSIYDIKFNGKSIDTVWKSNLNQGPKGEQFMAPNLQPDENGKCWEWFDTIEDAVKHVYINKIEECL